MKKEGKYINDSFIKGAHSVVPKIDTCKALSGVFSLTSFLLRTVLAVLIQDEYYTV